MSLLFAAVAVLVASGLLAACCGRQAMLATIVGSVGAIAGCALGLVPALTSLWRSSTESYYHTWDVPYGSFSVELDPLSALFLASALILALLAAMFGCRFLLAYRSWKLIGPPWFFFNLLIAGMIMVLVARNGILFLVAWEVMSLASYFLVTFDNEKQSVREAGRLYLIAMHLGAAFLLAFFVLLGQGAKSLDFDQIAAAAPAVTPKMTNVLFLLALVGFGTKAGLMPLHVSLPEAEPAAPSHAAAVMSGAMIKMGIYGILRTLTLLEDAPAWWGYLLIVVGIVSGVWGILFALAQQDMARTLAYSSIENEGVIALGIGSGLLGLSYDIPSLAALGFAGALFHVVNHGMFKGLLFMGAGAIQQSTGTRDVDRLGGLLRRMPIVGLTFLLASAAITAIPPLNGFVGEFLIYLGAFREGEELDAAPASAALAVIASLALVGGLALVTFTKLFGIAFLGSPRSPDAVKAKPAHWLLTAPMVVLAVGCVALGLGAPVALPYLSPMLSLLTRQPADAVAAALEPTVESLNAIVLVAGVLGGLIVVLSVIRLALLAPREVTKSGTWGCGYRQPTVRMQYTATAYAQPAVDFFYMLLRTRRRVSPPRGLFPGEAAAASDTPDVPHYFFYRPIYLTVEWLFSKLRWMQHGHAHLYVLYVGVTLVTLLIWYISRSPQ
jgi:formate hydrogenlyase subunit 3/multisubunit Na+/H+ antiporter MnhD subunit